MYKNNTFSKKCEVNFLDFSKYLLGNSGKIQAKFSLEMLWGILKSSSVLLSEIVRSNSRKVEIKNGVERLSRHLNNFDSSLILKRYARLVREYLPDEPLFLVDDTDIIKPCASKMEGLGLVCEAVFLKTDIL